MSDDQEFVAMRTIGGVLDKLDENARGRVVQWAASKYKIETGAGPIGGGQPDQQRVSPEDFVTLFDRADPQTEEDKALVAAYWYQVKEGNSDVDAAILNSTLHDLGHRLSNITRALGVSEKRKPALVRQSSKSGKAKQARKKYRLTAAGIRAVEDLLETENNGDEKA
jgi:hypothetical protein